MRLLAPLLLVPLLLACKTPEKPICPDPAPACSCPPSAAAPAATAALSLDLPKATSGSEIQAVISIAIDAKGNVSVNGAPVADDAALRAAIKKTLSDPDVGPNVRAVITADRSVTHGQVIHVLDVVKSEGISKIAFGVSALPSVTPAP